MAGCSLSQASRLGDRDPGSLRYQGYLGTEMHFGVVGFPEDVITQVVLDLDDGVEGRTEMIE